MSIEIAGTLGASALSRIYQLVGCKRAEDVASALATDEPKEDTAVLSAEGEKALGLSSFFGAKPGESVTLDCITSFGQRQLASFGQKFRALMRGNGIDMSEPITLGHESGTGRVIVTNDHPDAEKVEALINDNFELRNMYNAGTSALELARHAAEHSKFSEAYAANPQMAVAQYAYLFNTTCQAEVTFSDEGHSVSYNRVARL